jgi:hypothetical protein
MKRTVERIVPLLPAAAAVGASVCVSSLLFTTPPQPIAPQPVPTPVSGNVGRVLAAPFPVVARPARRRVAAAPAGDPKALVAGTRAIARAAPPSQRSPKPEAPAAPPAPAPAPPAIAPVAAPPPAPAPTQAVAQAPANPVKPAKSGTRPGWGHGDPNHEHTGPPGKGPKSKDSPPSPPPAPAPAAAPPPATQAGGHGNDHGGGKKSPGH